jgi:hypothetical protein
MSGIEASIADLKDQLAVTMTELERVATPIVPRLYKVPEAAKALRVDRSIVYDLINAGVLATITLPTMSEIRIPAAALDALVAPERWSTANLGAAS